MPTLETPNDPPSHEELYTEMVRKSSGLREEILTMEGGLLPPAEFARRVNRNPDSVQAASDARKLIGFEPEKGGEPLSLPAWQVHQGGILSGLEDLEPVWLAPSYDHSHE